MEPIVIDGDLLINRSLVFPNLNNTSNNGTKEEDVNYVPYESRPETYIVPALFSIIFIVGLLGNGTLVYIFIRNRSMRTIPNIYIICLALGDLLVIAGTLPFVSTIYTFESWPYGEFVCKASEFIRDVSVGVTVYTLTMLSANRYVAIVLPIRRQIGQAKTIITVAGIWTLSIILATPGAYFSFVWKVPITDEKAIEVCYPFPEELGTWYPKVVVMSKFLLLYAIPLLLIAFFYIGMARHLMKVSRNPIGLNETQSNQIVARTKTAKIVLGFVAIFAVCFFPTHVFMLWYYFYPRANAFYNDFWHIWRIAGFVLTFVDSCINPVTLYMTSGVFRAFFKRYLCLLCKRKKQRNTALNDCSRCYNHTAEYKEVTKWQRKSKCISTEV